MRCATDRAAGRSPGGPRERNTLWRPRTRPPPAGGAATGPGPARALTRDTAPPLPARRPPARPGPDRPPRGNSAINPHGRGALPPAALSRPKGSGDRARRSQGGPTAVPPPTPLPPRHDPPITAGGTGTATRRGRSKGTGTGGPGRTTGRAGRGRSGLPPAPGGGAARCSSARRPSSPPPARWRPARRGLGVVEGAGIGSFASSSSSPCSPRLGLQWARGSPP